MSQFEQFGVADVYQLAADVVIPAGTNVAIRRLGNGFWVMRVDLLRPGDEKPRHGLPEKLERDLLASRGRES